MTCFHSWNDVQTMLYSLCRTMHLHKLQKHRLSMSFWMDFLFQRFRNGTAMSKCEETFTFLLKYSSQHISYFIVLWSSCSVSHTQLVVSVLLLHRIISSPFLNNVQVVSSLTSGLIFQHDSYLLLSYFMREFHWNIKVLSAECLQSTCTIQYHGTVQDISCLT